MITTFSTIRVFIQNNKYQKLNLRMCHVVWPLYDYCDLDLEARPFDIRNICKFILKSVYACKSYMLDMNVDIAIHYASVLPCSSPRSDLDLGSRCLVVRCNTHLWYGGNLCKVISNSADEHVRGININFCSHLIIYKVRIALLVCLKCCFSVVVFFVTMN